MNTYLMTLGFGYPVVTRDTNLVFITTNCTLVIGRRSSYTDEFPLSYTQDMTMWPDVPVYTKSIASMMFHK